MNKKIILLVAVLLIVAIVFVACKSNGDVEEPTESTTESTTETTSGSLIGDISDGMDSSIIPEIYNENAFSGEGDIIIGGQENNTGEDSIAWDEVVGNNS